MHDSLPKIMQYLARYATIFDRFCFPIRSKQYSTTFSLFVNSMASGERDSSDIKILEKVNGFEERRNTLLLGPPKSGVGCLKDPAETVVFFPGDVQNYENILKHHEANKKWKDWTFENTMYTLQQRFPDAQIVMVTPSRRVDETFSCYDNFMETDVLGSPVSCEGHHAWEHLRLLLENAWKEIRGEQASDPVDEEGSSNTPNITATDSPLTLIGFSKGCTVLNQLMYELEDACSNTAVLAFIRRIQAFYWLDGGHAGTIPTYVTDDNVLREVSQLKATFNIHVTPYQVKDEGRPHIGEDHLQFTAKLMQYGADVKSTLHFRDESRSLKKHFEVLKLF